MLWVTDLSPSATFFIIEAVNSTGKVRTFSSLVIISGFGVTLFAGLILLILGRARRN